MRCISCNYNCLQNTRKRQLRSKATFTLLYIFFRFMNAVSTTFLSQGFWQLLSRHYLSRFCLWKELFFIVETWKSSHELRQIFFIDFFMRSHVKRSHFWVMRWGCLSIVESLQKTNVKENIFISVCYCFCYIFHSKLHISFENQWFLQFCAITWDYFTGMPDS